MSTLFEELQNKLEETWEEISEAVKDSFPYNVLIAEGIVAVFCGGFFLAGAEIRKSFLAVVFILSLMSIGFSKSVI
jgi:hypothetical protein